MKAEILTLLRDNTDYISGQELCERFGVSRTAVWKAVNQLKKEGYEIEAVQNRGYRLVSTEEIYGRNELSSRIHTRWVGKPLHFFDSLGSTNAQAKIEAEDGAVHGTLIVADMQSAGRGRRGRSWASPAGTNIYFTLILKPEFQPDRASMFTLVMACSVARAIADETGLACGIKWPNDIVVSGRKVCGILTEMSAERDYIHYVVIGVGINVAEQEFVTEIADKAVSLNEECGRKISRSALTARTMECFEEDYECFLRTEDLSGLQDSYNQMLVNRDARVCVLDPKGEFQGTARGITPSGELLVELEDGTLKSVYAGEVSVRGIYGYV